LTRQGITDALALYHRTKSATHTFIPQALRSVTWSRLADNVKINLLVDSMKGSEPARNLALLTTPEVVEHSIRQNLLLDSLGTARTRFAWGELAFEQAQVQRRLQSDLARLSEVNGHIHRLLDAPPAVPRQTLPGEPELAAANWITGNSRSAADPESVSELQARIRSALSQNRQADLLDIHTIDSLHSAVYQPAAGQVERVFRSSSDPLFMGSDVGRAAFVKALDAIRIKVQAGQVDAGEALFAAIVRYHPYGDGNGRTARTLYALAQLNKQESSFKALTTHAEHMLSPPMPSITF
jgi:fido (protein-threonine AMPylation protein)